MPWCLLCPATLQRDTDNGPSFLLGRRLRGRLKTSATLGAKEHFSPKNRASAARIPEGTQHTEQRRAPFAGIDGGRRGPGREPSASDASRREKPQHGQPGIQSTRNQDRDLGVLAMVYASCPWISRRIVVGRETLLVAFST
ncbi:hypothetical protein B296_00032212 [Ensete ventricosum]|uniref:Uncharacterized protein n=1 Tax=Ensete ventricosum TaxID=4639 RepID=A0A427AE96_ENSVE|nr:hypothetical protein B296_00032212 [Ensete ventricosum]